MDITDKTLPPRRGGKTDSGTNDVTMKDTRTRIKEVRFQIGDLIMGRYRILTELGQGGMGVVYRCLDETAGIEIALKALPPELSHNTLEMEDVKENFQLIAKLVHQNIAISKQLEKDEINGNYYLIMECCEGKDLRLWLKQKRADETLTLENILPIIQQIADALDYAHEMNIIHRDIKPGNIMIDQFGKIKVLDFGLAAQIHTSMTRVSMAYHGTSGTGPYMAPEQWRGCAQGAPADQYALAVMTYEMLAGHLPFEGSDPAVLQQAVLTQNARDIADIPKSAQAAIKRAMSKEPADRFESCSDFAAALGGKKIDTAKKQNKVGLKWVTVLLTVLLLGTGITGYYLFNKQKKTEHCVTIPPQPVSLPELHEQQPDTPSEKKTDPSPKGGISKSVDHRITAILKKDKANTAAKDLKQETKANQIPALEIIAAVNGCRVNAKIKALKTEPDRKSTPWKLKKGSAYEFLITYKSGNDEYVGKIPSFVCTENYSQQKKVELEKTVIIFENGTVLLPDGEKLEMVKIPGGSFRRKDGNTVQLTNDYWLGKFEVTQAQYEAVMGNNPSFFRGRDLPVEKVSWNNAKAFCSKLNKRYAGKLPAGYKFDLPTEAQWEYACRAGTITNFSYGNASDTDKMNFDGNYPHGGGQKGIHRKKTVVAGSLGYKNAFGLYDMHGNVWEWCRDWYSSACTGTVTDPAGPSTGSDRVRRGGGWNTYAWSCRSEDRGYWNPDDYDSFIGFRLALVR